MLFFRMQYAKTVCIQYIYSIQYILCIYSIKIYICCMLHKFYSLRSVTSFIISKNLSFFSFLLSQKSDFAIGKITVNKERSEVVDYSVPFWQENSVMVMKRKEYMDYSTAFIKPFSWQVWLFIGLCIPMISILYSVIVFLSRNNEENKTKSLFSLVKRTFWFVTGAILKQSSNDVLIATGSQINRYYSSLRT